MRDAQLLVRLGHFQPRATYQACAASIVAVQALTVDQYSYALLKGESLDAGVCWRSFNASSMLNSVKLLKVSVVGLVIIVVFSCGSVVVARLTHICRARESPGRRARLRCGIADRAPL